MRKIFVVMAVALLVASVASAEGKRVTAASDP